jgi:prepilin-type N-terminal cleavage/methylation domain-containing protein
MRAAFSLIELSIVLVILGLLTGGILTGQNLIRAAELRSVTTQLANYNAAVMTFRDKYFALPGDMRNATDFWGAADSSGAGGECSDPNTDEGTDSETCNGDGDSIIGNYSSNEYYERFTFWEHLANAGLITGSYTGIGDGGASTSTVNINVPAGKFGKTKFETYALNPASANYFPTNLDRNSWQVRPKVFFPEEVWNIDTKLDDGKPGYGAVTVFKASVRPNCATTDSADTAEYDLGYQSASCDLFFTFGR